MGFNGLRPWAVSETASGGGQQTPVTEFVSTQHYRVLANKL